MERDSLDHPSVFHTFYHKIHIPVTIISRGVKNMIVVGKYSNKKLITIERGDNVRKAFQLMEENNVRHLPVMEDRRIVGIISERDLRKARSLKKGTTGEYEYDDSFSLEDLMTPNPITINPEIEVSEAAKIILEKKIGCLPVMEGDRLVGIITKTDIINLLIEIIGLLERSKTLSIILEDRPDIYRKVVDIIKDRGGEIISTSFLEKSSNKKEYLFRIKTKNLNKILAGLRQEGFKPKKI